MSLSRSFDAPVRTIVLAEGAFGRTGGKTANGVVMHSQIFDVGAVVDSTCAGQTADAVLRKPDLEPIPVVDSIESALHSVPEAEALVIGVAPAGGILPEAWKGDIRTAIAAGCDVVSGLHQFLSEDDEWAAVAREHGGRLFDVRKPPTNEELRVADGKRDAIDACIVLVAGTDCAVGKRTTTFELYRTARQRGFEAAWVATGQTGIMLGAEHGVVIDRVPSDFAAGVVEEMVVRAGKDAELVFVEGQANLTHRAYSGVSLSILHGAWPDKIVMADQPDRSMRTHFEQFSVGGAREEIALVEQLVDADVIAVSTWGDPESERERLGRPAVNVYRDGGTEKLFGMLVDPSP